MAWNPEIYNQFKSERAAPFLELLELLKPTGDIKLIDLGCGTGETTKIISERFPAAMVTGIDSSAEMLAKAGNLESDHLHFRVEAIDEQLAKEEKWDIIFSNAAIQWVNNHEALFPKMISRLNAGGQLAIQMPAQHHNITNILLDQLAEENSVATQLQGFKRISPVLNIDRYAEILFENGAKSMTVFEKIYPLILPDTTALYNWVSGTALIPYLEKLDEGSKEIFIEKYQHKLSEHFRKAPVFYPFKRLLMHAQF